MLELPSRGIPYIVPPMPLDDHALDMLEQTSRTFFIPIMGLPAPLRDAVGSAYLCFRAIDEIEDHPDLPAEDKVHLATQVGRILKAAAAAETNIDAASFRDLFHPVRETLPDVTLNLPTYAGMAPAAVSATLWESIATMAERMAHWAGVNWKIRSESDLDEYTYDVAGCVGLLLTDLWAWHDGTEARREHAIGFGRSLQAVNIARNRDEDRERGVDFFPEGWTMERMFGYIRRQFEHADAYIEALPDGPAREFCEIPLLLAKATLEALESGKAKLSREEVIGLVRQDKDEA